MTLYIIMKHSSISVKKVWCGQCFFFTLCMDFGCCWQFWHLWSILDRSWFSEVILKQPNWWVWFGAWKIGPGQDRRFISQTHLQQSTGSVFIFTEDSFILYIKMVRFTAMEMCVKETAADVGAVILWWLHMWRMQQHNPWKSRASMAATAGLLHSTDSDFAVSFTEQWQPEMTVRMLLQPQIPGQWFQSPCRINCDLVSCRIVA